MSRRTGVLSAVILACVFFSGCSKFTNALRTHEAERFVEEFELSMDSDNSFISCLENYAEVKTPELLAEQKKLFNKTYEPDFDLDLIEVASSGNKGSVDTIIYYHDLSSIEDIDKFRTYEEWIDEIEKADIVSSTVELDIKYVDGNWEFVSFDEWISKVMEPYASLGILNENGEPVNPNAQYYSEFVVDPIWYDPMLAIPLNSDSISDPIALQCAFYFSRPISGTFKCVLRGPDNSILGSSETELKASVISIFDFSAETLGINKFESGKYTMELLYNDEQIAVTEPLLVR